MDQTGLVWPSIEAGEISQQNCPATQKGLEKKNHYNTYTNGVLESRFSRTCDFMIFREVYNSRIINFDDSSAIIIIIFARFLNF